MDEHYWTRETLLLIASLVSTLILAKLAWRWRRYARVVERLPMLKVRWYHLLGHAQGLLYLRTLKTPFPHHVYDFQIMNGYSVLFRAKSLASLWAFCFPIVQIHRADAVQTVLSHSEELQKMFTYKFLHSWLGDGLLVSHGSKWKTRRRLLTPAFHFNVLKDFVVAFNKQAAILSDVLTRHTEDPYVDIVPVVTKCSFDIMCETMLGVEEHAQTNPSSPYLHSVSILTGCMFERMVNPFLWPDFVFKMSPLGRKFSDHMRRAQEFTYKIIAERKKEKLDDPSANKRRCLLDLMLDEHIIGSSDLSESDIREEIDTFTFEGHDTTAMGTSWSLYLIGLHPGVQQKVHQELDSILGDGDGEIRMDDLRQMKYLECVIKESLRLYPPVPYFGRHLQDDLEFQGMTVPRGSMCTIFPYFLHRDPEVFPNPEKFDPDRFSPENSVGRHPFSYIPFSAGPRNCIGQRFALLEEKVVLATLLKKFSLRSLDPRDKVQVMDEIVLRPLQGLRVEVRPRGCEGKRTEHCYYP